MKHILCGIFLLAFFSRAVGGSAQGTQVPVRFLPGYPNYNAIDLDLKLEFVPGPEPGIKVNLQALIGEDARYDFGKDAALQQIAPELFHVYQVPKDCKDYADLLWPDPFRDADLREQLHQVKILQTSGVVSDAREVLLTLETDPAKSNALRPNMPLYIAYEARRRSDGATVMLTHLKYLCIPKDMGQPGAHLPTIRPNRYIPGTPLASVTEVDLAAANATGVHIATRRKIPAVSLNLKDILKDGAVDQDALNPDRFHILWYLPASKEPLSSPIKKPFENEAVRNRLVPLKIRGVESTPGDPTTVYVFFDQTVEIAPLSLLEAQGKTVPAGAQLFVAYEKKSQNTKTVNPAGTPGKVPVYAAVAHKDAVKFTPPQDVSISTALSAAGAQGVTLNPTGGPVTLVDVSPVPTLPPVPPGTPPDRPSVSLGAVPISNDKADVVRLKIGGVSFQDLGRLFGWKDPSGRIDFTTSGMLSSNDRDPDASLGFEWSYIQGIRNGVHGPENLRWQPNFLGIGEYRPQKLMYTALQANDEGLFFNPRLLLTKSQSAIFGHGDHSDGRSKVDFAPLRFTAKSRSPELAPLTGIYRARKADDPDLGQMSLSVSLVEVSYDYFSRSVVDANGRTLGSLRIPGLLGPQAGVEGQLAFPLRRWLKDSHALPLTLEFTGSLKYFYQDRNAVVRDYFRRIGTGQVPIDLPHFGAYASDWEAALSFPIDLGLLGMKDATKIRLGYRSGFPQSQSFYDIFAHDRNQWFIEFGIK